MICDVTHHGVRDNLVVVSGRSKQDKVKRDQHATDMSVPPQDPLERAPWIRPAPDECDFWEPVTFTPDGADPVRDRIVVRMTTHARTDELIEFAVIHLTFYRGKWRNVAAVDSCHDVDIHFHRYSRTTDERVGEPEVLMPVVSRADIQNGYEVGYKRVAEQWETNRRRWHDA